MSKHHRRTAFTLIELLVAMALGSILTTTMIFIYQKNNESYAISALKNDLYRKNLTGLGTIRQDIKKTNRILTNFSTYTASSHCIILQIPTLDSNQSPINNTYYHVIYQPDPNNPHDLQRIEINNSTTTRTINRNLSSVTFTPKDNLENNIVNNPENTAQIRIDLALTDNYRGRTYNSTLTSNETMRNK